LHRSSHRLEVIQRAKQTSRLSENKTTG
jgi:hypothetical protein